MRVLFSFWSIVLYAIIGGFGWFIWFLCRPSLGIGETLIAIIGFYGVLAFFAFLTAIPGFGAIPVKFGMHQVGHRFFFCTPPDQK